MTVTLNRTDETARLFAERAGAPESRRSEIEDQIVRLNMPEEIPPAHSHDEPPGTSHHHGASGTLNPAPEAELHLDD